MHRAFLPKALALTVLTAGLSFAGAQQTQSSPDAGSTAGTAPMHHRHAPNPERQAEFITKKLNLTPDQTAKIEPILATRDQQIQALWQNSQLTPQDRHQQMRAINEQAQQQMATVLSADQMAQLKSLRRFQHRHHNENGGQPEQSPSA